jgi:hypothetical protein
MANLHSVCSGIASVVPTKREHGLKRLMDANEIVVHKINRHHVRVVLGLLGKAFVSRVMRRLPIRIERF